jgi:hypothetical protein
MDIKNKNKQKIGIQLDVIAGSKTISGQWAYL